MFRRYFDHSIPTSLAFRARRQRFALFHKLVDCLEPPVRILDVGGTESYWRGMPMPPAWQSDVEFTLLNLQAINTTLGNFTAVQGDARDIAQFTDKTFHIAFSNSVIEHVGGSEDQRAMANEIKRVAHWYFIQTPNRHFPMEPHFIFPFFQFLPVKTKVWLLQHFDLGWYRKCPDRVLAQQIVNSIQLLDRKQFAALFPEADLYEEKVLGLTKSFIVYTSPQQEPG